MKFLPKRRGCLGCGMLLMVIVLCSVSATFAIDRICYGGLSQRLPIYPNAEVKSRIHNLFTEFGMGNTVIVLDTPDEPNDVRSWYGRHTGTYIRGVMDSGNFIDGVALRIGQGQWDVSRQEDGTGSQIILFGTCAN